MRALSILVAVPLLVLQFQREAAACSYAELERVTTWPWDGATGSVPVGPRHVDQRAPFPDAGLAHM